MWEALQLIDDRRRGPEGNQKSFLINKVNQADILDDIHSKAHIISECIQPF